MAFWNKRKDHEPWRLRQYGSNLPPGTKPPPPPAPPARMVNERTGETPESVRDTDDWRTYMAGFSHGLAVARSNTNYPPHPQRNAAIPDKPTENEGVTGPR